MIQDKMLAEIQELKLSGYTLQEVYDLLKSRHTKVPTIKTVRKYYNMNDAPNDNQGYGAADDPLDKKVTQRNQAYVGTVGGSNLQAIP